MWLMMANEKPHAFFFSRLRGLGERGADDVCMYPYIRFKTKEKLDKEIWDWEKKASDDVPPWLTSRSFILTLARIFLFLVREKDLEKKTREVRGTVPGGNFRVSFVRSRWIFRVIRPLWFCAALSELRVGKLVSKFMPGKYFDFGILIWYPRKRPQIRFFSFNAHLCLSCN